MNAVKISLVAFFVAISLVILYYGGMFGGGIHKGERQEVVDWKPEKVPDVQIRDLRGKTFALSSLKGKVVLLNFWATWCPPCIKEFPSMLKLVDKYDGRVVLVAVSHDDSVAAINHFLNLYRKGQGPILDGPNVIMAWDREQKIALRVFNVLRLPETIILDRDMNMVKKYAGAVDWTSPGVTAQLDRLLK